MSQSTADVDEAGVHIAGLAASEDVALDVLFDDRRIWSFRSVRDTTGDPSGLRTAKWPGPLQRFLEGTADVVVQVHGAEGKTPLYHDVVQFGEGTEPIEIVNAAGQPLGVDYTGRLQLTFETRTADQVEPLLDSLDQVLTALHTAGVEAFPAYGTLLGAVRDGALIGHDSDADVAYVSRHTVPIDVIRESFELQRKLANMGLSTTRYSGAGFKVIIREPDGHKRGLDVFTGFFSDGYLHLMGEIRTPFAEEWIFPLGTTTLEGRKFPAPADPERLLAATYGESWRVPDPAFSYETPQDTHDRLNAWFRGIAVDRKDWDRRYVRGRNRPLQLNPASLARLLFDQEGPSYVVDVGCGKGRDARWLARCGCDVLGLDFSPPSFSGALTEEANRGLSVTFEQANLLELRHVLSYGARLTRLGRPVHLMANHTLDALVAPGRDNFWRLAQMLGRTGGRTYLDFVADTAPFDSLLANNSLRMLDPDEVTAQAAARGAHVVHRKIITSARPGDGGPRNIARMVFGWDSP